MCPDVATRAGTETTIAEAQEDDTLSPASLTLLRSSVGIPAASASSAGFSSCGGFVVDIML